MLAALLVACGEDATALPVETLRDPNTCMECHPQHVQQWSGSMHAYASDDPVFVAMNKRGQRETNGALGDFCVKCHAPMAVALGLTNGTDFDPAALPAEARGITCYFCHNVASVEDTHNNGLVLANDQTMRGGVANPIDSPAHFSKHDPLVDSDAAGNGSQLCGSCHDIVVPEHLNGVPGGVAVERTYQEWQGTFFATNPNPGIHLTCGDCHMISKTDIIADAPGLNVPSRTNGFHEHMWPAVDQALTAFPETTAQAAAIKRDLDGAIGLIGPIPLGSTSATGGICVTPVDGGTITVRIDGLGIGHKFPSGAAQDRRVWLELVAFDASNNIVFQSGVVPDGMDPEEIADPKLQIFWDQVFKADNTPAHFFWEIARNDASQLLHARARSTTSPPACACAPCRSKCCATSSAPAISTPRSSAAFRRSRSRARSGRGSDRWRCRRPAARCDRSSGRKADPEHDAIGARRRRHVERGLPQARHLEVHLRQLVLSGLGPRRHEDRLRRGVAVLDLVRRQLERRAGHRCARRVELEDPRVVELDPDRGRVDVDERHREHAVLAELGQPDREVIVDDVGAVDRLVVEVRRAVVAARAEAEHYQDRAAHDQLGMQKRNTTASLPPGEVTSSVVSHSPGIQKFTGESWY
jgi:nitrate/TMAO reductase-like tetraheme cytochrome c subunit